MSVEVLTHVFSRYPRGGGEYALALAIADYAWPDGSHVFPSIAALAKKSRQSERAVQGHLRGMVACGWLSVVKRSAGGRGISTEYRISKEWLNGAELAGFLEDQNPADRRTETPQIDARNPADCDIPIRTTRTVIQNRTPLPPDGGASESETPKPETPETAFADLCAAYPRKRVNVGPAGKAWKRIAPDAELARSIVQAARRMAATADWQAEGGRWAPKLASWLRAMGWADPAAQAQASASAVVQGPAARPPLTPEQLAANRARADAAVARIRGQEARAAA